MDSSRKSRRYTLENLMAHGLNSNSDTSLDHKIEARERDFDYVKEIKNQTAEIADRMRKLAMRLEDVTDDSETVKMVLSNMQEVMKGLSMAALPLANLGGLEPVEDSNVLPQRVIRVRVDNDVDDEDAQGQAIPLETSQISEEGYSI
ncbi:unnamed protein product [Kuraishia capsulata CBS 1993]|uniref:DASH complex subunit DAD2 n=1 Tax=Kuraishia capsulata CBS 1993 TaxID=1382522 RepID=W6MNK4_9ASCO|nr:uncharacterized protein KUCA_T00004188001 [Kuraishia capsulata CBS 1993]CDK28206.1 unnamed protein product [Kuraishia capsulata CBS 1993]